MNTTNLFVELMVIGIGAVGAMLLGVAAFLTTDLAEVSAKAADNVATVVILAPMLALTYVLGIIVDRAADRMFQRRAQKLRVQHFGDDIDAYHYARRTVLSGPPKLAEVLEYARSRMRICRGWAVNALILLVVWNLFATLQLSAHEAFGGIWIGGNLLLAMLWVGSWLAWRSLVCGIYSKVHRISEFLSPTSSATTLADFDDSP